MFLVRPTCTSGEQKLGGLDGIQVDRHTAYHIITAKVDCRQSIGDPNVDIGPFLSYPTSSRIHRPP